MNLPLIVRQVREEYLSKGLAQSFQIINSGLCDDFASDVCMRVPGGLHNTEVSNLSVANFQSIDESDDDSGRPFDRKLLRKHWPAVIPPSGLTWNELDALSADAGFDNGTHVWISFGDMHFDAECPDGVHNFFELPFFQRVIADWMAERNQPATVPAMA